MAGATVGFAVLSYFPLETPPKGREAFYYFEEDVLRDFGARYIGAPVGAVLGAIAGFGMELGRRTSGITDQ